MAIRLGVSEVVESKLLDPGPSADNCFMARVSGRMLANCSFRFVFIGTTVIQSGIAGRRWLNSGNPDTGVSGVFSSPYVD